MSNYNTYVQIGEHYIEVPAPPSDRSMVLFVDQKPADAYWRRELLVKNYKQIWFDFLPNITQLYQKATLYSQDGALLSLNKEDSEYIESIYRQETYRRVHGVHFKNGDRIEYITGDHYFLLMWARMMTVDNSDFASYREFQRDFYYLIKHTWSLKRTLGLFISKPKKTGITNLMWSGYYLNKSTLYRKQNMGNMNIKQDQGAKTFKDYFLYSFNGLVPALKPSYTNLSEQEGYITFKKSYGMKKGKPIIPNSMDELNTNVFCVATEPKAFDVAVMNDTWYDEPPKYKGSFENIFTTNKEAIKFGGFINGRAWLTSYTPDEDNQSFREARAIFLGSKLSTAKEGKTESELICWHIPSYVSWIGENNDCFNKYGKCDQGKAMNEKQQLRDVVKENPRKLQAITRQYADNEREAWASAGAGSTFDNMVLGDLLADLEIDQRNNPGRPYVEGRLVWENILWETKVRSRPNGQFCPVKFVPLTDDELMQGVKGRFRLYQEIPLVHLNAALKNGRDEWGCLIAPRHFLYVGGADPTNYAAGSEVTQGSKNAYMTMNMPDERIDSLMGRVFTKVLVSEYYYRPELPDEAYEDLVKEIIYLCKLMIVEANAPYTATRLLEEGLGQFMMVKDENGIIRPWERWMGLPGEEEKKYKLIRMTSNSVENKEMMETIVRIIKNYFRKAGIGEKNYGRSFKSERALKQFMDFDPTNTLLYDLVMCFGYTLLALEVYLMILLSRSGDFDEERNLSAVLSALAS